MNLVNGGRCFQEALYQIVSGLNSIRKTPKRDQRLSGSLVHVASEILSPCAPNSLLSTCSANMCYSVLS